MKYKHLKTVQSWSKYSLLLYWAAVAGCLLTGDAAAALTLRLSGAPCLPCSLSVCVSGHSQAQRRWEAPSTGRHTEWKLVCDGSNMSHRVHERVHNTQPESFKKKEKKENTEPKHLSAERWSLCDTFTQQPGRLTCSAQERMKLLRSRLKHVPSFPRSLLTFENVDSPVNHDIIHWAGLSWNKSVKANSSEPSLQPTATCKSTHLIRLPISANYNAAYRRHLATIINALVRWVLTLFLAGEDFQWRRVKFVQNNMRTCMKVGQ